MKAKTENGKQTANTAGALHTNGGKAPDEGGTLERLSAWLDWEHEAERLQLALTETENTLLVGASALNDLQRDRYSYDRQQLLEDCLDAWRFNPLARRIVELTSQYAAGGGVIARVSDPAAQVFIDAFWNHRLNRMEMRLTEFSDELSRSGNLFVLLSTDAGGMSYLRVVPSSDIARIESKPNDVEQEVRFYGRAAEGEEVPYSAYDPARDQPDAQGRFGSVMLHYAVNRPAGAQWGEPDLAPILRWLARYASWLEDRVRLNRFRNAFLYVVRARFNNESARTSRQIQLSANPPLPGSILVTDENEEWSVLSPRLEALDASTDGLAIKKMIAAGVGLPLHFLAEPESSTRTTAEAAGGPTYRRFEQRQRLLFWIVRDILQVVLRRRAFYDPQVNPQAPITVHGGDITSRDNATLAQAGRSVAETAQALLDMDLINRQEYLRLVYRFLGENLPDDADLPEVLDEAKEGTQAD